MPSLSQNLSFLAAFVNYVCTAERNYGRHTVVLQSGWQLSKSLDISSFSAFLKLHSLFTVWVVLASRTFLPIQKRSLGVLISEVHKVNNKLINTFKDTHIFLEEEHCISLTEFCWWLIFLVVNLCNWIGSF